MDGKKIFIQSKAWRLYKNASPLYNNNKVYSRHVQCNSSQMEYENKIPKSDMALKPR